MKYSILKTLAVCFSISLYVSNTISAQEDLDFDLPDISIFDSIPASPSQETQIAPEQPQVQQPQTITPAPEVPTPQADVVPSQTVPSNSQVVEQPVNQQESVVLPPVDEVLPAVESVQEQSNMQLSEPQIQSVAPEATVQQVVPVEPVASTQTSSSYPSISKQPWISSGWGLGLGGGPNLFYGDLGIANTLPSDYSNELNWAGTFLLQKQLISYVDMRGQLLYGTLSGYKELDNSGSNVNLRFDATVLEYNMNFKIHVTNAILGRVAPVSLYTYVGIGFSTFRSYSTNTMFNTVVSYYGYDGTTKYDPTIETMVPVGLGLEFKLSDNLFLNTDVSMRFVNSDKLDAHVGTTNDFLQDMYSFSSVGISYTFGSKSKYVPPVDEPSVVVPEVAKVEEKVDSVPQIDSVSNAVVSNSDSTMVNDAENQSQIVDSNAPITSLNDTDIFKGQDSIVSPDAIENQATQVVDPVQPIAEVQEVVKVTSVGQVETPAQAVQGLVYRIQILAVQNQQNAKLQEFKRRYGITEQVYEEKIDTWYKFTLGNFTTIQEASNYRQTLVNKGIQGAFVVPYYNGNRITLQQAREMQAK